MNYKNDGNLTRIHTDWACLLGQSHRLKDSLFYQDTLTFAMQLMEEVKVWVHETVAELESENYRFVETDRVLVEPDPGVSEWIEEMKGRGMFFSIALQAWLRIVGSVNLTGTHPSWTNSAFLFEGEGLTEQDLIYTDPLVLELPSDYALYLLEEWKETASGEASPHRVDVAPDHLHKSNISGGLPYQLSVDKPSVDGILWNERHCTTLIGYLRTAISWGGFPGFSYIAEPVVAHGFNRVSQYESRYLKGPREP